MSGWPTLRQLLATTGVEEQTVVAGRSRLGATVSDVQLVDRSRSRAGTIDADVLVVAGGTEVWFELSLEHFKAGGAVAVFVTTAAADILASTRWLADRVGLALIACADTEPLELAERLRRAVHGHETDLGLVCADVARRLGGNACGPDRAVDVLRQSIGVDCSVIGGESLVLAGPPADGVTFRTDWLSGQVLRAGRRVVVAVPAAVRDPLLGPDLWLVAQLDDVTDERARVVQAALEVVSLGVVAWAATNQLESQRDAMVKSAALMQLLTSRRTMPAHVVEEAIGLGWSLNGWHVPLCLRVVDPLPAAAMDAMTERVRATVREAQPRSEVVRAGQGWLCWVTRRVEPTRDVMDGAIEAAWLIVRTFRTQLVAGVGSPRRGGVGLIDALVESQDLAATAGHVGGRSLVEHARTSSTRRLVMSAVTTSDVSTGSSRLLEPLRETGDDTLLTTLETFLALESSKAATAAALHLHRNTVSKRIERIGQLLQVDLADPEVRLALRIACHGRTT